ncbi:hypothetical protein J437_LFUL018284 [Ladona fulva]|uniref:WH1 domain-containing protein n=1 Tax=Ladona fulva TaxID=123851 RepID=A0A8K0KF10_LADFU|nr:hypothetical protein J437_LFUL018284 [Ladona fulva]
MKSRPSDQYASCPQLQKGPDFKAPPSETELALRHFTTKYDSYRGLLQASRRRLSDGGAEDSPGDTTNDSAAEDSAADDAAASGRVTEQERLQIESFFRGLKTNVFVCRSLANLYVGRRASAIQNGACDGPDEWDLHYTGIPVVILDVGETRSRNKRRISMLLAERGSCFALWQDTIDHLTAYTGAGKAFHTMHLSADHRRLAGLSFDCTEAADELLAHIESLTAKPENISLSVPGGGWGSGNGSGGARRRKLLQRNKRIELPPKSQISQPCCFQHVISVDAADRNRYFSLQALVPPNPAPGTTAQQSPHAAMVTPQALTAGGDIS